MREDGTQLGYNRNLGLLNNEIVSRLECCRTSIYTWRVPGIEFKTFIIAIMMKSSHLSLEWTGLCQGSHSRRLCNLARVMKGKSSFFWILDFFGPCGHFRR